MLSRVNRNFGQYSQFLWCLRLVPPTRDRVNWTFIKFNAKPLYFGTLWCVLDFVSIDLIFKLWNFEHNVISFFRRGFLIFASIFLQKKADSSNTKEWEKSADVRGRTGCRMDTISNIKSLSQLLSLPQNSQLHIYHIYHIYWFYCKRFSSTDHHHWHCCWCYCCWSCCCCWWWWSVDSALLLLLLVANLKTENWFPSSSILQRSYFLLPPPNSGQEGWDGFWGSYKSFGRIWEYFINQLWQAFFEMLLR